MGIRIALAGNPNCGKTTLFNALTGSNQFVGNWPGVTVEYKEGKYKGDKEVKIVDLPGIYSLSPYTLEEVVSRNYLIDEKPEAIINVIDGTNLERNLYLTTQIVELGIPVVIAINMMDVVEKNGDKINTKKLSEEIGVPVIEISALKNRGLKEIVDAAVKVAKEAKPQSPKHRFNGSVEHAFAHIEELCLHGIEDENVQRWYSIKLFERDEKIQEKLGLSSDVIDHIEKDIASCEKELDDDAESIITGERYNYIGTIINDCVKKAAKGLTISDKIDKVVTNRWLALPIFAVVMWLVYYISVTTVGTWATDWANDGVFGDGWHLFAIGSSDYADAADEFTANQLIVDGYDLYVEENGSEPTGDFEYPVEDEETAAVDYETASLDDYAAAKAYVESNEEPDPANYGVWIPGVPVFVEAGLDAIGCNDVVKGLILDGIVAGVGAVLGFVPQMLVLFIFLAFLEACGYMARVAFIMDRIFRKFGLSGKSFIPMLIGTGCGVPGIMASRTIENDRDRKMTIMTTTFIPCGAKLPFIAMVAGAIFGGASWVAPSAYFLGIFAIITSGIMLKKTKMFAGDPAPFVMELPAYHWPTLGNVLRSMWERGWSFIKKAGTIILLSTIVVWFCTFFGVVDGAFTMLEEDQIDHSILAGLGRCLAWIFIPLGFGDWEATVASITGLVAKENIVGTLAIIYGAAGDVYETMRAAFTDASGFAFLAFNLLCAPCFAAMGAIKREMNNTKWFWRAIGYQCGFAWVIGLIVYQVGKVFTGEGFTVGTIFGIAAICVLLYGLFRKDKYNK
ncbi:ferrous iron transport protein B [Pseudobutyrivibrio sp. NOR37]|uniref:Fe(2+) transporter FeoB n=1 Tax=Pseudobutyrivibrio xylanivorans TaxID=185007 RepID=A0A6M0LIP3_PSEXY|nr:ferrous iron transporter B [Pseudobutyrivibrio sp. NOR37]NEX02428.1 ferrous iron transporter B [Pseudobutyrivibrio xylanivorans]SFR79127.1 ferrous iron transport protein B [Pseudobutyrivibrio sp. NOR37]